MTVGKAMTLLLVTGVAFLAGARWGSASDPLQAAQEPAAAAAARPADIYPDSLARLPKVKREELDAEGRRVYDLLVNPASRYRDGLWGPVGMWMYSPPMAEHIFAASTYLRFGTDLDQRLTELAILVTARELDAQYEWTQHEPAALKAGLEPSIVDIVRHRRGVESLGQKEALIIRFGRELIGQHNVSSKTFAEARALLGEQGVMNLSGLMGYYTFVATTINTFDVQLRPDQKPLLP